MIRKGKLLAAALPLALLAALAMISTASADHNVRAHVSQGAIGGNGAFDSYLVGTVPVGSRAYFESQEKLVASDTDSQYDIYERLGTTTTLMSTGPTGGNGAFDPTFEHVASDGSRIFFSTAEKLVASDTDSSIDVYERNGSTTVLISTGPSGGNGAADATFFGASTGGTRVFFDTTESLVATDTDTENDLYQRQAGTTTLLTTGPTGGNGAFSTGFLANSTDGTRVFFETDEKLVAGDTDAEYDIYERTNGTTTTLISAGAINGNGAFSQLFGGITPDGTKVVFETDEKLVAADTDARTDVYMRSGGTTTQVSAGVINGNGAFDAILPVFTTRFISDDGAHVFFETDEKLVATDTDAVYDVYDRSGGTTTKVSTGTGGNGAFDAFFLAGSTSGTTAFFETEEEMAAGDTDGQFDTYRRQSGTTTRETTGPLGGNGSDSPVFVLSSADGARVIFEADESLEAADTDGGATDVYERFAGATTRLSTGTINGNGNFIAFASGATDDASRVFFDTQEPLMPTDTDAFVDLYVAVSSPIQARPGSASPLRIPLVPAYKACTSPNSTHVAPLTYSSCTPPALESTLLTMGTGGAGSGFFRMTALPGNTGTPADEADIAIQVSASDVKRVSDAADYTGNTIYSSTLRITDRSNGFDGQEAATVQDFTFSFLVPCTATGGAAGSNCGTTTTMDTLVPNSAKESKRMSMQSLANNLYDLGADGSSTPGAGTCPPTCGTGDEKFFLTEGVFQP